MKIGQKLYKMKFSQDIMEFEIIQKSCFEDLTIYTIESGKSLNGSLEFRIIERNGNIEFYNIDNNDNHFLLNQKLNYFYKTKKEIEDIFYKDLIKSCEDHIKNRKKDIDQWKIDISNNKKECNKIIGSKEKIDKLEIGQKIYDFKGEEYEIESILNDKNGTYYNINDDDYYSFSVMVDDGKIVFNEGDDERCDYYQYKDYEFKTTKEESRLYGLMIKIDELEKKIKRLEGFNKESELKINKFKNKIK